MTAAAVNNKTHTATYTVEEYLALEIKSDTRSEFRDGSLHISGSYDHG